MRLMSSKASGVGWALACAAGSLLSLWTAVAERHLAWLVTAFLWLSLGVEGLDQRWWSGKTGGVRTARSTMNDSFAPPLLAPPSFAWLLLSGLPPHLPCTNPDCSIFGHYPPVCDFCYGQCVQWECRTGAAVAFMVGEGLFILMAVHLLSQVSTAAPTVVGGLFFVIIGFPTRWWRGKTQVVTWLVSWGWGRFVWQACDECQQLIEAGDDQEVAQRAATFVPQRLALVSPVVSESWDAVRARQQRFFLRHRRPRPTRLSP